MWNKYSTMIIIRIQSKLNKILNGKPIIIKQIVCNFLRSENDGW